MNIQGLFRNRDFLRQAGANLGLNMGGMLDMGFSGLENIDPNRELGEEDCLMEIEEGKKRQCSSQFSSISS